MDLLTLRLYPKKNVDKPAVLVELKYDKVVDSAMMQIKEKRYASALDAYRGSLLLVGINYAKKKQKA